MTNASPSYKVRTDLFLLRCAVVVVAAMVLGLFARPALSSARSNADGDDVHSLRDIAFQKSLDKDVDGALEFYQRAVDRARTEYGDTSTYVAELYYEMGSLALDNGKPGKASDCFQQAVQHNPNCVMSRIKLAETLRMRHPDKPGLALQQIQAALRKDGSSPEARQALVSWLISQHNYPAAVRESYALSRLLEPTATASVPPPTPVAVPTAAPAPAAPAETTEVANATPPSPMNALGFWHRMKKTPPEVPAPKPVADQKKLLIKPKETAPKPKEKPASKDSRHGKNKHEHKEKQPAKAAPKSVVAHKSAGDSAAAQHGVLNTNAELKSQTPVSDASAEPPPTAAPAPAKTKHGERKHVMTVPPPPTVPVLVPPAPPVSVAPPPVQKKKVEKPKSAAKETSAPAPSSSSSGGGSDDPDFILNWADVNKKKHK